jgi:hypothetical protein
MIIVSIGGGLGNQMYQYAFCTQLKRLYPDTEIKLDILNTMGDQHHGYELKEVFGINAPECTLDELRELSDIYPADGKHYKFHKLIERFRHKFFGMRNTCLQQKDGTIFYDSFFRLDIDKSYYLYGAFANYQYFKGIEEDIRELYTFKGRLTGKNLYWKEKIESTISVSMHIRRGDYVDWGVEILSDNFYRKAIDYIQKTVKDRCTIFVFSDEPQYAREHYADIPNLEIVEGNTGKDSYLDMWLMSLCKHNIIANSTFSFWGAFLNRNPDKIVVAPNKPYTGCKNPFVCDGWVKM